MQDAYYREQLKDGNEYELFIAKIVKEELAIQLQFFTTKEEQYKGETLQGFEIKHDKKFKETGNLYIELFERTTPNKEYTPAGVLKKDNSWLYIIGNKERIFFFSKKQLKFLYENEILPVIENKWGTSKAILLPEDSVYFRMLCLKEIKIGENK